MIRRARILFVALLGLGILTGAGCKKKDHDEHWTGSATGSSKTADTKALQEGMAGQEPMDTARAEGHTSSDTTRPAGSDGPESMAAAGPGPVSTTGQNPKVAIRTSAGDFLLELDPKSAPVTVKNFLRYVDEKFYDGTIFHRVMVDFMIQGGGFGEDLQQKQTHEPIKNEADNGLKNLRGTVAMARTQVVDSATAQFFINVKDNPALDHRGPGPGFGYAVFGKVVEGMEVVDKIRQVNVQARGMMFQHLPATPVIIRTVRRVP